METKVNVLDRKMLLTVPNQRHLLKKREDKTDIREKGNPRSESSLLSNDSQKRKNKMLSLIFEILLNSGSYRKKYFDLQSSLL